MKLNWEYGTRSFSYQENREGEKGLKLSYSAFHPAITLTGF